MRGVTGWILRVHLAPVDGSQTRKKDDRTSRQSRLWFVNVAPDQHSVTSLYKHTLRACVRLAQLTTVKCRLFPDDLQHAVRRCSVSQMCGVVMIVYRQYLTFAQLPESTDWHWSLLDEECIITSLCLCTMHGVDVLHEKSAVFPDVD